MRTILKYRHSFQLELHRYPLSLTTNNKPALHIYCNTVDYLLEPQGIHSAERLDTQLSMAESLLTGTGSRNRTTGANMRDLPAIIWCCKSNRGLFSAKRRVTRSRNCRAFNEFTGGGETPAQQHLLTIATILPGIEIVVVGYFSRL